MARLILLLVSGTLLFCGILATSRGDVEESIEKQGERFARDINHSGPNTWQGNPEYGGSAGPYEMIDTRTVPRGLPYNDPYSSSYPSGGEMYQPPETYSPYDPYSQQVPFALRQPETYPAYQPAPAVQPEPEAYPIYLPGTAAQPQPQPYPVYQPALAVQPQPAAYPNYQPAPAAQPQPEAYPVYLPASGVQPQPEPYPVYQPAPAVQPQPAAYPIYQPAPAVQPQPAAYPIYQPAPAVQPQPAAYPIYQPAPAVQPQPEPYPVYQPAPAVQPQPAAYPIYQPAPAVKPQPVLSAPPVPVAHPQPVSYPSAATPGQPYVVVRYIPGLVSRKYQCRQKVECGWNYTTKPGRYIYIRYYPRPTPVPAPIRQIAYVCPRPQCPNVQQPCVTPAPVYPPAQVVYPPAPVYPLTPIIQQPTCSGHNQCATGQYCCYVPSTAGMGCNAGTAVTLRSQRHLQLNNTANTRSHVELVIGQWKNRNVTSLVTELLLPLKVDLETDMEVILRSGTALGQDTHPCNMQDTDCVGSKLLTCVAELWPSEPQPLATVDRIPQGPLPTPTLRDQGANSTEDDFLYPPEASFWNFEDPASFGEYPAEIVEVDPVLSATHARQVRQLSFAACLLQSFGAGVAERKRSALLAAKRCVRAYKLEWSRVRACVAPRGQGAAGGEREQDSENGLSLRRPVEMSVNGELVADLDNLKLALCQALFRAGQAPLLCDLLYDELNLDQEEQDSVDTEEYIDNLFSEDQDVQTMRNTNYPGYAGAGEWSGMGLGSSDILSWDQAGRPADRMQEDGSDLGARSGREYEYDPEQRDDESVGFSMNRISHSLDEIPVGSPAYWAGGHGEPYEV